MAVIQTAQGRVIGLIIESDHQPKVKPAAEAEPVADAKAEPAKKPGRPAKK